MATTEQMADPASHPLLRRVDRIALRARRWLRLRAVAIAAAVMVGSLVLLVLLDSQLRWVSPLARWTATAAWWVTAAAVLLGVLYPAFTRRLSRVGIARRLERNLPRLGDRLSSAVSLLESDARTGQATQPESDPSLRRQAIAATSVEVGPLPLEQVLDRRPTLRLLTLAMIVFAVAAAGAALRPATARIALERLSVPWAPISWPRRHHLQLERVPETIHVGSDLRLILSDRQGELPADAVVQLRPVAADDASAAPPPATGPVQTRLPELSGRVGIVVLGDIRQSFDVRAIGGDDTTMPWRHVRAIPAPDVVESLVTLRPPGYTQLPPRTVTAERFEAQAGSEMSLQVRVSQPLQSVTAVLDTGEESIARAAELAADGRQISVNGILLDQSTTVRLRWVDREGISGESPRRWRAEVREDAPPQLRWQYPMADREVTADARLEVAWQADDDLGLRQTWLRIDDSERLGERLAATDEAAPRRMTGQHSLDLARWPELRPGDVVQLTALAEDLAGQLGQSTVRRLQIVAPERIAAEIERSVSESLEGVRAAARQQQIAIEQAEAAAARLDASPRDAAEAQDRLRSAAAAQRGVANTLDEGSAAALEPLRRALAEAAENQLEGESVDQLRALARRLETVLSQSVWPAESALRQGAEEPEAQGAEALSRAAPLQQRAAEEMGDVLRSLERRDSLRQAEEALADLIDAQERLAQQSASSADLAGSAEEGRRLAQRQRALARQTESLAAQLQSQAGVAADSDPRAAARLEDAAERLHSDGTAEAMRRAADRLERQQTGAAVQQQAEVAQRLRDAAETLAGRDRGGAERLAAAMEQALADAAELESQQRRIASQIDHGEPPETVDPPWQSLQEQTAALADRVHSLGAGRAAETLEGAAQSQQQGRESLLEDDFAAAAEAAEESAQQLAAGREQMQQAAAELREQVRRDDGRRLAQQIGQLRDTQRQLVAEFHSATEAENAAAALSPLAEPQRQLAGQVEQAAAAIEMPLFGPVLATAAERMRVAAARADRGDQPAVAAELASEALARLEQVAAALEQAVLEQAAAQPGAMQPDAPQEPDDGDAPDSGDAPRTPPRESLLLMRSLQAWIEERTGALAERRADSPQEQRRVATEQRRLAEEQQQLAQELQAWVAAAAGATEEGEPAPAPPQDAVPPLDAIPLEEF